MNRLLAIFLALTLLIPAASADTNTTMSLTLRECIERALAQNLDIQIERINPSIARWGVVSAQGVYDPILSGGIAYEENSQPQNTGSIESHTLSPVISLAGKLPTGLTYELSSSETRSSGTLVTNFVYTGTTAISVTQPLLKGFGFGINAAQNRIARKTRAIAEQNFLQQVMNTVSDMQNAYYELVYAIENHKALLEDLERAKQLLAENRRRLEIGVMSPLDVTQAEAGAAEREEAVIVAEQLIRTNENALKRLIARDVTTLRGASLVPVDVPVVEMVETDVARSTLTALRERPDYLAAKHDLDSKNILVQYNRNQLWPEIDLQGSYGVNGRSGVSFSDYVDNSATGDSPVWTVGVTATFPLGDRASRAGYRTAKLQAEQSLLSLKRLEQNIVVGVDNAVLQVQSTLKRVDATRVASRLAQESLDAEVTKLRAGTSTSFLVLQAQSQLAAARSAELRAKADYSESLVALALSEGTTLRQNNITLDEKY